MLEEIFYYLKDKIKPEKTAVISTLSNEDFKKFRENSKMAARKAIQEQQMSPSGYFRYHPTN